MALPTKVSLVTPQIRRIKTSPGEEGSKRPFKSIKKCFLNTQVLASGNTVLVNNKTIKRYFGFHQGKFIPLRRLYSEIFCY
jgi:hypothetical protein